jgi:phage gp45-like
MITPAQLAAMEERLRSYIDQRLANTIEYTQYSRSSALGAGDKTKGHRTEGAGEQEYDHEAQRLQHFGLRSLPPAGTWCVRIGASGSSTNSLIVAEDPVDRYGPQDLEDGEVAIYNKVTGCIIKLDKDGNVEITAAAGKNITATASGAGVVHLNATAVTGAVKLGPVGTLKVATEGATDSMGVPITLNPVAAATIVKAG